MQRLTSALLVIGLFGSATLWIGCGGPATKPVALAKVSSPDRKTNVEVPEWFANVPEAPGLLYAVATAQSRDMSMALNTAKHYARVEMAKQVEVKIERLSRQPGSSEIAETSRKVVPEGSALTSAEVTSDGTTVVSREISSVVILRGGRISKQEVRREGNLYRVYVLMEMPLDEANIALLSKGNDNSQGSHKPEKPAADVKMRWLEDLDKEIEKYERWKKEHGQ